MKRALSLVLILAMLVSLVPVMGKTQVSAKEDLSMTWNYGTYYGTPNPDIKIRRYTVIPCQEGDILYMDFPSDNWAIYVHFADAQGDFGLEYLYHSKKPDAVVVKAINGRMPTELRLTTFYRPNTSATLDDALWSTFDVNISKSTILAGDLLGSAQWKQGSYENPAATIRKQCQIPCAVGDTFRFDFTGKFWNLYILPGDENGAITLTNTYLSKDATYTVKQVNGKDPTNLILVAVPTTSMDINDQVWQSFAVSCVKESNMITVASQNYGLWYNGVTQGVEEARVETAAAGWQKMVTDHNVDILMGQEWLPHFDQNKTIDANNKVFGKIFEYQYGKNTSTYDGKHIASKTPLTDIQYVTHPGSGRKYTKAYTTINGKKICLINAHLSFEEDININRKAEIMELLAAAQGEEYVIFAGDFNVFKPSEFQIFAEAGYSLANAGAFGEFNTWPNFGINAGADVNRCLDNIIVSANIIIRDAFVDYRQLSDHAMVVAKLELLDEDGADDRVLCDHCNQLVSWQPWTAADGGAATTAKESGHYYLTSDLPKVTGAFRIGVSGSATPNVVLDLRGHSIHSDVTRAFYLYRGSKLTVMDSVGGGEISTSYTGTGAVLYVEGTSTFTLESGTVRATDTTTAKSGGAIYAETGANVTINGGSLYGSKASKGGAICGGNQNVITVNGGSIYGAETTGDGGGAIYMYNGTLTLTGGTIYGGSATSGGAINAINVKLDMSGGTIQGGTAKSGGAIYLYDGTMNMTNGTVCGGSATNGGAIYANRENLNLNGGMISGGNVMVTGCSTAGCMSLGGCAVTGGIYVTTSGKMKVLKTFTGESQITLDASQLPNLTPGAALNSTYISCEGSFSGKLYLENLSGNPSLCGVDGDTKVYIGAAVLVQADQQAWYVSNAAAVAAYGQADYLLPAAGNLVLSGANYTVDLAGKTLDITGSGSLSCLDSVGNGTATVAAGITLQTDVTAPNGNRYIALAENGAYTFHQLDLQLKAVTLRTEKTGIYYKAEVACDATLAEQIDCYGVVVSVLDMPDAAFESDSNDAYTKMQGAPDGIFTSGSIVNIFREGLSPERNALRGEMKIYARPYLKLKDGTVLMAREGAAYSLLDVLQAMDSNWDDYSEDIQSVARNFYQTWAPYGMELWADQLSNIDS